MHLIWAASSDGVFWTAHVTLSSSCAGIWAIIWPGSSEIYLACLRPLLYFEEGEGVTSFTLEDVYVAASTMPMLLVVWMTEVLASLCRLRLISLDAAMFILFPQDPSSLTESAFPAGDIETPYSTLLKDSVFQLLLCLRYWVDYPTYLLLYYYHHSCYG